MNKATVMNSIKTAGHKVMFTLKKRSPEIFIVAGVIGVVTSAVMACKATTKVGAILEDAEHDISTVKKHEEDSDQTEYTSEDAKKDMLIIRVQTGVKFIKLYGPSVALGVFSIASILASNDILRKRSVALATAYATVDQSFKEYRNRVIDKFGETVDKELKYGIKAKTLEKSTVDPETGEVKTENVTANVIVDTPASPWAFCYEDARIQGYGEPSHDYDIMFLRAQQNFANDKLRANHFVFLSDIFDWIGVPQTMESRRLGWIYDPKDSKRDGYIDFGIQEVVRERNGEYETVTMLDFNVDGVILYDFEKKAVLR